MSKDFHSQIGLLHKVVTVNYSGFDELIKEYLFVGNEIFDTEVAIFSDIRNDVHSMHPTDSHSSDRLKDLELNLREILCHEVFNGKKTIHFSDAEKNIIYKNHPIYTDLGLRTFISSPVFVEGEVYGALNFLSKNMKEGRSNDDVEILEMMAQSMGRFLEIERYKKISENSAKMALLGQMVGGIAHEINNPMAVISSNSEFVMNFLRDKGCVDREVAESLSAIKNTVHRVRDIVSGLKTIMGGRKTTVEAIPLRDLIDATMSVVWDKFKKSKIEIINDVSPLTTVYANQVQLSQVILNLAQNSYDAILENENLWINFSTVERNGFIELLVKDCGLGIKKDLAQKIMKPFYTTKETGKGTGLGLSLSKSILEGFGGDLIYDHHCINTCFKVRLEDARVKGRSAS